MHLSEFLLVTGTEWEEIPNFSAILQPVASEAQVQEWIDSDDLNALAQFCEQTGIVAENGTIQAARLFNTGEADNRLRFWIVR